MTDSGCLFVEEIFCMNVNKSSLEGKLLLNT